MRAFWHGPEFPHSTSIEIEFADYRVAFARVLRGDLESLRTIASGAVHEDGVNLIYLACFARNETCYGVRIFLGDLIFLEYAIAAEDVDLQLADFHGRHRAGGVGVELKTVGAHHGYQAAFVCAVTKPLMSAFRHL